MRIEKQAFAGLLAAALCACGGGGGGGSGTPPVEANLSQDQKTFESVNTQGGQFSLIWRFPFGGGNLVSGTDYLVAISNGLLPRSPSQGAQVQTAQSMSLDWALAGRIV